MNKWFTLFTKEILELSRNYKLIWFPLSFILLGVMDPLTNYYMPQILDAVGGLPEGAVIEIPKPTAVEVFLMSLEQFKTLGVLIIVLSFMGMIAAERKSGVAQLVLGKPVSYQSYVSAKWGAAFFLISISLFIGLLSSWYYIVLLFERIPLNDFLSAFLLFETWLAFIMALVLFFSALFKHSGMAGMASLVTTFLLSLISGYFSKFLEWSPSQLSSYLTQRLVTGEIPEHTYQSIILSIIMVLLLLLGAVVLLKNKELAE